MNLSCVLSARQYNQDECDIVVCTIERALGIVNRRQAEGSLGALGVVVRRRISP
jgi:hypothetical protein